MNNKLLIISGFLVGAIFLGGCGPIQQPAQTNNSTENQISTSTEPTATSTPEEAVATSTPTATTTPTGGNTTTTKPPASTPTKPALSATDQYIAALRAYKSIGYYFQFYNCHGTPGSLVMKVGKKFMLDNRDKVSRRIAVGSTIYNIAGYGFAIVTAPSKPGKYYITCNGGGAANIVVEK